MIFQLRTAARVAAFSAALALAAPAGLLSAQEACRAGYYTQCTTSVGVTLAAPPEVAPAAVDAAAATMELMLANRPDIAQRLAARGAALVIIPRDQPLTVLPEFAYLAGQSTSDGRPYDGPAIRGLGGSSGRPTTAAAEENLLRLTGDVFFIEDITIHEFAHAIMNVGFSGQEANRWRAIAAAEKDLAPFAGTYAAVDEYEFWAEMSQAWFRASSRYNAGVVSPEEVWEFAPQTYAFLTEVYGEPGAGLPRLPASYDDEPFDFDRFTIPTVDQTRP